MPNVEHHAPNETRKWIAHRQNEFEFIKLLKARSAIYTTASNILGIQIALVVIIPAIGSLFSSLFHELVDYAAIYSLLIALIDASLFDPWQRQKIKLSAKISEQFDCDLFEIPWNSLAAGHRADPEQIEAAANAWRGNVTRLQNWYPAEIDGAPLPLARAICQRSNAWYDGTLRAFYGSISIIVVFLIFFISFLFAIYMNFSVVQLGAAVLAPAAPALLWSLREFFRQREVIEIADTTKAKAESLAKNIAASALSDDTALHISRQIQDGIYARRKDSPLILPFIYRFKRNNMEIVMKAGATKLLAKHKANYLGLSN